MVSVTVTASALLGDAGRAAHAADRHLCAAQLEDHALVVAVPFGGVVTILHVVEG